MRRILAGFAVLGLLAVASPAQAATYTGSVQYLDAFIGETPYEVGANDTIVTTQAGGAFSVTVFSYDPADPGVHFYVDGPAVCEFNHCNARHPVTNYDCQGDQVGLYASSCGFASAPAGQWFIYVNTHDVTSGADVTLETWTTIAGDDLVVTGPGPFNE
jgi:hypothetical protein